MRVAILYLTPVQFTALWWTEISYKVGALSGIALTTDVADAPVERVLLFVSRFGAFCVGGAPVAMGALPARNRRAPALSQLEILEAAARISIGEGATARDLVKAAFENPTSAMADHYASFRAAALPFESEHWSEMPVTASK